MSDRDAVLFANEAYYQAFSNRDVEAMDAVWAPRDRITCIHPGWAPLFGREEVMKSWAAILRNPESPHIDCRDAEAIIDGNTAYVLCYEEIAGQYLTATNIFVRDGSVWRMTHHQAGLTEGRPRESEPSGPDRVH